LKFNCPHCGKECDYMEIQGDKDLMAIIRMVPAFGRHSNLVMGYCYLFGISPMKLKAKKFRILLEEMKGLFESESFRYQKRLYRISQAGIAEALNIIIHRNFSDRLESHNYLKKIMITIAEREAQEASKQAERDLRKKEDRLQYPYREMGATQGSTDIPPVNEPLTPEQIEENRRKIQDIIKLLD